MPECSELQAARSRSVPDRSSTGKRRTLYRLIREEMQNCLWIAPQFVSADQSSNMAAGSRVAVCEFFEIAE
jgi:hypothetical protein